MKNFKSLRFIFGIYACFKRGVESQIEFIFDPDDRSNYYSHLPGGHFGYRNFSPGGPQNFFGSILPNFGGKSC